jgi:hypothetical protein
MANLWLINMEKYRTGTGQDVWVHPNDQCHGGSCVIHSPSKHCMSDFPTHWRDDINVMERVCPHGIGHPDPDDLNFKLRTYGLLVMIDYSTHGCDGCCTGKAGKDDSL